MGNCLHNSSANFSMRDFCPVGNYQNAVRGMIGVNPFKKDINKSKYIGVYS